MTKRIGGMAKEDVSEVLMRLLSVVEGSKFVLPDEMLTELQAISREGADPAWQINEMQRILDRWMPRH